MILEDCHGEDSQYIVLNAKNKAGTVEKRALLSVKGNIKYLNPELIIIYIY